jgi:hypothetical protein
LEASVAESTQPQQEPPSVARHNRTLDGSFVELAAAGDIEF